MRLARSAAARPRRRVVIDAQGSLYGTTGSGGTQNGNCSSGCGVLWEIDRSSPEWHAVQMSVNFLSLIEQGTNVENR